MGKIESMSNDIERYIHIKCTDEPTMHTKFKWFGGSSNYERFDNLPEYGNYNSFRIGTVIYPFHKYIIYNPNNFEREVFIGIQKPVTINRNTPYYAGHQIYVPEYKDGTWEENWSISKQFYRLYFFNTALKSDWGVDGFINPTHCGTFPIYDT